MVEALLTRAAAETKRPEIQRLVDQLLDK